MANLVGAAVSGQSAAAQGQILMLALAGAAVLNVTEAALTAQLRQISSASTLPKSIGWAASFQLGSGESNVFQKRSA
jgi:hypothetical protein